MKFSIDEKADLNNEEQEGLWVINWCILIFFRCVEILSHRREDLDIISIGIVYL